jgi:Chaperone of endosialidase
MKKKFVKPRVRDIGDVSTIVRVVTTRTVASSRRWKMNIKPIDDSLGKVGKLRGVSFEWKDSGRRDIGLIAEETGKIVPEVVTYEENGVDAKSLDYAHLVALIIEAVKEQQRMIEEQRKEIQELKAAAKILASRQTGPKIRALT